MGVVATTLIETVGSEPREPKVAEALSVALSQNGYGPFGEIPNQPCEVATSRRTRRKRLILALNPKTHHLARDLKNLDPPSKCGKLYQHKLAYFAP